MKYVGVNLMNHQVTASRKVDMILPKNKASGKLPMKE